MARYRGRAFLAFISLTIAAITTLVVPVAVRRVVDFGLSPEGIAMINSYFGVMVALVAVLAGASAARFYLVMTIGERIVADIRRDVLAHLVLLSPSFFDSARSGELVSRLTADTVHLFAHNSNDLVQRALGQKQVAINASRELANVSGPKQQLMADNLGLCRCFP